MSNIPPDLNLNHVLDIISYVPIEVLSVFEIDVEKKKSGYHDYNPPKSEIPSASATSYLEIRHRLDAVCVYRIIITHRTSGYRQKMPAYNCLPTLTPIVMIRNAVARPTNSSAYLPALAYHEDNTTCAMQGWFRLGKNQQDNTIRLPNYVIIISPPCLSEPFPYLKKEKNTQITKSARASKDSA